MARSRKKAIYKDKGFRKENYWKTIRRIHKTELKKNYYKEDFSLTNPKVIIDDCDYCDYKSYMETMTEKDFNSYTFLDRKYVERFRRK